MKRIDIIIPVKNEEKNIAPLLERIDMALTKGKIKYRAIFVDDNSSDKTVLKIKAASKKYPVLLHKKKGRGGKAYSILEGARLSTTEYICMIDGDLQYSPETIPEMLSLVPEHGVVVANRKTADTSRLRSMGSKFNKVVFGKLLLGLSCDTQSGLKIFRKDIVSQLSESDVSPWTLDMPLLSMALAMGYSVGSVDMHFAERANGVSKVNFVKTSFEIAKGAVRLRFNRNKVILIEEKKGEMKGAGLFYARKRFVTHTNLHHSKSAVYTFTRWQKMAIGFMLLALTFGLAINAKYTAISVIAILSAIYFADALFGLFVLLKSLHFPPELSFSKLVLSRIKDKDLPVYSILCPLYKESAVLPHFVENISKLDWPKRKLDVLLLLEENDIETIETARKMKLPKYFRIIIVPDSKPKTKPKACNYGLHFVKGEYVVIYDAEDRPEPEQLKKTFLGFQKVGPEVACLQSKLNYYNPQQNILTRLFTAEYSLWFDIILPGLQSIETTIPLGGTSNHFRAKDLKELQGWDPFNVTEDCDLGVRLFKLGYKTAIVDSVTLEEANSNVKNWIRQRSRWIKGYFQTYLVHMRNPITFFRSHGTQALLFQLVIGMRMSFMLINPFLWVATISYFALYHLVGPAIEALYPTPVFYVAIFSLTVGNFMYLYNYMIGCAKRGHWGIVKFVFLIPFYWILTSIAAFMAFYQLIVKPHYWEKTHHGLHLAKPQLPSEPVAVNTDPEIIPTRIFVNFSKLQKKDYFSGMLLIVAGVVANFLNFVTSAYLGRLLTPSDFGLIALMGSFLFFTQLPSSGISQTLSHKAAFLQGKYGRSIGELWSHYRLNLFKISLVLSIFWLVLTPVLAGFFNSPSLIPFMVFAPMWTTLMVGAVDGSYIYGSMKFHWIAALNIIEALSKLMFSVLLVEFGLTSWVYAALPLSTITVFILTWWAARGYASKNIGNISDRQALSRHLAFPKKFFATAVLTKFSAVSFLSLDLIFVKHYLSAPMAGEYSLLALVGRMIYLVSGLFAQFILPVVSKEEGAGAGNGSAFKKLLLAILVSSLGMFMFVGPLGKTFVPLLFGGKAFPIIPYLTRFSLSMIFFSVSASLVTFHQAKRQYIFATPGILSVLVQGMGLLLFHSSISDVVSVMLITSMVYLLSTLFIHVFYDSILVFSSNVQDFVGLFILKINGKRPLPAGQLRILMLNWRDIKHMWAGGAEVYVHEQARRWVKEGHHVTMFCGNDGRNPRNETIDGVKIIRRGGFYTVYVWAFLYYIFRFRGRFDVVVESENGVPFFTPLYSTVPKILIVHHVHQEVFREHLSLPLSVFARLIERRIMPLVYNNQQIVAVSNSTKADLVQLGIAQSEHIEVVNPGINVSSYSKAKKTKHPSFVYLGRHKAYKNIDVALKAFAIVHKEFPNASLTIAGDGEMTGRLKSLSKGMGLGKSIVFVGRVSERKKTKLLSQSWVALQPSSFEGWGITVIETNACGTPVIASDVKGLRDSVIDGETGILVPVKNVKRLSQAMIELVQDRGYRAQLSRQAYRWSRDYDWDKKSTELSMLVEEIVRRSSPQTSESTIAAFEEE